MRRRNLFAPFMLVLLFGAAPAHADNLWYKLWYNADQRGERLLKHGDATAAAHVYRDPRRKAYAELRAGNYQQAARDFSAFDDSDSNYNRGNALAQAGQLQEALKAYDAALARNPGNRDARHNRDLVAKALQQQPPPKPSSGGNTSSRNGKDGKKGSSGPAQGGKRGAGTQDKAGKNPAGNRNAHDQQGKAGQGSSQQAGQGRQQSAQNASPQPGSNNRASASTQADEAAQARRDAAAALGKPASGNPQTQSGAPVSEQQLAQEQWLRRIPDDPGGLLRRKFMIEHMIRQQGGQP